MYTFSDVDRCSFYPASDFPLHCLDSQPNPSPFLRLHSPTHIFRSNRIFGRLDSTLTSLAVLLYFPLCLRNTHQTHTPTPATAAHPKSAARQTLTAPVPAITIP